MVNEKDDVVVEVVFWSGVEQRISAKEAQEALKQSMLYLCIVNDIPFQVLLEAVQELDEDIFEGVLVVTCDPRNITRIAELSNFGTRSTKSAEYKSLCAASFDSEGCGYHRAPDLLCP